MSSPSEEPYEVLIIGGGPCALCTACTLLEVFPTSVYKEEELDGVLHRKNKKTLKAQTETMERKLCVLDESGSSFLSKWKSYFDRLEIPYLRSPVTMHPDPRSTSSLHAYATKKEDLLEIDPVWIKNTNKSNVIRDFSVNAPFLFNRPSNEIFTSFCEDLVKHYKLQQYIVKARAERIEPIFEEGPDHPPTLFKIYTTDGRCFCSKAVVCSLGGGCKPRIPAWIRGMYQPRKECDADVPFICHSSDLPTLNMNNEKFFHNKTIAIIGGGLMAGQVALLARKYKCKKVVLIIRGHLRSQPFCLQLEWMGSKRNMKLAQYWSLDVSERYEQIMKARGGGGSMTAEVMEELKRLAKDKPSEVQLLEECEVCHVDSCKKHGKLNLQLCGGCNNLLSEVDRIVLSTGMQADITQEPLLKQLPAAQNGPLPSLDQSLRLIPGWDLFMIGAYAALQVGPDSGSLSGSVRGAHIISDVLRPKLWPSKEVSSKLSRLHVKGWNSFELLADTSDSSDEENDQD